MHNMRKKTIWISLSIAVLATTAWAAIVVSSKPVQKIVRVGQDISFPMDVDASEAIAGLNGEITYDATYLSNPRVSAAEGATGFTVMGNEVSPGHYRFCAFRAPTGSINLAQPALTFMMKASQTKPPSDTTQVTYSMSAVSRPNGTSFGNQVAFETVTLDFGTGALNWGEYR